MEKNIHKELKSYTIYKCVVEDLLLTYRHEKYFSSNKSKQRIINHTFRLKSDQFDEL